MGQPAYTPPITPAQPTYGPPTYSPRFAPPVPPKKRSRMKVVLLVVAAGLVALCGVGTVIAAASGAGKPSTAAPAQTYFSDCPFAAGGCPRSASPAVVAATGVPVKCADGVVSNTGLPNYCSDHGGVAPTAVATKAAPPSPTAPKLTASQQQALVMAREYLAAQAFSRPGLIKQLQYEGFGAADATYAADAVGADWTAQADAMAKDYLSAQAFSRSGLIKQLEYEGFTAAQAQHGATAAGL